MAIAFDGGLTCSMGVSDLGKAIDWYEEVLGFSLLYRVDDIAWAELSTSVEKVNLGLSQVEEVKQGGGVTPTFGTQNIEAAKADLDAKNVRQDGPIQTIPDMVKLLTFYDPDGNALMFYQDIAETA
ncbi:VOC family protein [Parasphingopyxis algicola]|uniref:VOC family protein n=1 Tax=Parasphingopyxis algicola TaxID=2026624 RepID=UPI0015A2F1B9|nr:VOC family protein [Parasphingopyxis algicola]QLC25123.1 VOC family protein [Parasphingopyxis algicola]